jgi:4-amino-4-deoxy-L-arabinose transferase-like glycosyltransferase
MNKSPLRLFLGLSLLGLGASIFIFWIMAYGPGGTPDSVVYIETAKSLLAGKGFCIQERPITHWPPGYPLLLAGAALVNPDIALSGRYLQALLLGANVILMGLAIYISGEHRLIVLFCAVVIFLFSPVTLLVHAMAWSEAAFIMLSLSSYICLAVYFAKNGFSWLLASAMFVGLASITRYVGITLIFPAILALVCLGKRSWKQRIMEIFTYVLIAGAPLVFWLFHNMIIAGNATNRRFAWHPVSLEHARTLIMNLTDLVIPNSFSSGIYLMIVLNVLVFTFICTSFIIIYNKHTTERSTSSPSFVLTFLSVIFPLLYLIFLFVSKSSFDADIPLDNRLLYPVFVFILLAVVSLSRSTGLFLQRQYLTRAFTTILIVITVLTCVRGGLAALDYRTGLYFTSPEYRDSETIASVKKLPDSLMIYSNGAAAITFLTGKVAASIPFKINPSTKKENPHYKDELKSLGQQCRENKAIIVYLYLGRKWFLPSQEELAATCDLQDVYRLADGAVYRGLKQ